MGDLKVTVEMIEQSPGLLRMMADNLNGHPLATADAARIMRALATELDDNAALRAQLAEARKDGERLKAVERRFAAMLPLFEEARDALPAIPLALAKLCSIRFDLADRMDDVGVPDRWKAIDAARGGA